LTSRGYLSQRRFHEEIESIDDLARDLEKLLDQTSQGLPAKIREAELCFHLINSLPDAVSFQLKLKNTQLPLPRQKSSSIYTAETINIPQPVDSVRSEERDHLDGVELIADDQTIICPQQPLYSLNQHNTALIVVGMVILPEAAVHEG